MTTDLEQRLRDALHEDAERARLVNPNGPPVPEARPLAVDQHRRRSPRKLVAVAAAVVLLAAATVAVIQNRDDDHDLDTAPLVIADLQPGSTVELPPGPLGPRDTPALVWSGREMIVWGGFGTTGPLDDGAAFDPTTGEWRVIAQAPIDARSLPQVAWTGSEMLVVGGYHERSTVASPRSPCETAPPTTRRPTAGDAARRADRCGGRSRSGVDGRRAHRRRRDHRLEGSRVQPGHERVASAR